MGLKPGSRFGEIFTGWTGLAGFWLALLLTGAIGAGVLYTLGPPDVASAGRPEAVPQAPIDCKERVDSCTVAGAARAIDVDEPRPGATAAAKPANAEDLQAAMASLPTAPQPHQGGSPAPLLVDSLIGAPSQVAMAFSLVPKSHVEEDSTNSGSRPVDRTHMTLHYVVDSPIVDAAAKRLSAQLGVEAEMRADATASRAAVIRYASGDDHAAAREAGKLLGEMGYSWKIEMAPNHPDAASQRAIEIWLPNR